MGEAGEEASLWEGSYRLEKSNCQPMYERDLGVDNWDRCGEEVHDLSGL